MAEILPPRGDKMPPPDIVEPTYGLHRGLPRSIPGGLVGVLPYYPRILWSAAVAATCSNASLRKPCNDIGDHGRFSQRHLGRQSFEASTPCPPLVELDGAMSRLPCSARVFPTATQNTSLVLFQPRRHSQGLRCRLHTSRHGRRGCESTARLVWRVERAGDEALHHPI